MDNISTDETTHGGLLEVRNSMQNSDAKTEKQDFFESQSDQMRKSDLFW